MDSVVGFISGSRTNQVFIHYWFSFFQKVLDAQATQVAQKNINLKTLCELQVIVPPLSLQEKFVTFAEQTDKSKFELERTLTAAKATMKRIVEENLN